MTYSTIEYEKADLVARIWMNRPEVHNAQNELMLAELDTAFATAGADPEVRVIVLAGRGRSFSSGHDLKRTVEGAAEQDIIELRKTTEGRLKHEYTSYYSHALRIRDVPKPTIAQVHGHCIAAGLMLASMCDLIVASRGAAFSNPVLRMGALGVEVLVEPWELGVRKAKEFLFLGDSLTADEAKDLGMVNRVVDDADLTAEVDALAQRITTLPPVAAQLMKQSLNATWDAMGQQQSWSYHFMIHQLSHATDEYQRIIAPREGRKLKEFIAVRDAGATG
ncbi:MAG TPA: enoyl-CoA hydratase [Streptosporangiaceae bacterium]|jgi:enoyl-CoA hydratase